MSRHRSKAAAQAAPVAAPSHAMSSSVWEGKWYNAQTGNLSLNGTRLKFETPKRVVLEADLSEVEGLRWPSYREGATCWMTISGKEYRFCFIPRVASGAQTREGLYNGAQWRAALAARTGQGKALTAEIRPMGRIIYDMVMQLMLFFTACCCALLPLVFVADGKARWWTVVFVVGAILYALVYAGLALREIWRLLREAFSSKAAASSDAPAPESKP